MIYSVAFLVLFLVGRVSGDTGSSKMQQVSCFMGECTHQGKLCRRQLLGRRRLAAWPFDTPDNLKGFDAGCLAESITVFVEGVILGPAAVRSDESGVVLRLMTIELVQAVHGFQVSTSQWKEKLLAHQMQGSELLEILGNKKHMYQEMVSTCHEIMMKMDPSSSTPLLIISAEIAKIKHLWTPAVMAQRIARAEQSRKTSGDLAWQDFGVNAMVSALAGGTMLPSLGLVPDWIGSLTGYGSWWLQALLIGTVCFFIIFLIQKCTDCRYKKLCSSS